MLPLGICDGKIVTDNLNRSSRGQRCPRIPAILINFFVFQNVWCKTTLVTDCRGIEAELLLDTCLQMVIDFTAHFHRFCEVRRASRQDHKLLHSQLVSGMRTSVNNIECWYW
ncbi:hypothetical protein ALC56_03359 [Trachymyrmex septentrionalis]|uniref:Uncharacterized protein n=1 Tax=Trachymyrmex septentrionalis TaxID=34720 RepID=A0A195FP80_9HYME|nr:hypothetical protein ALC56_03359 [Trachymyrmex septentrionalis]